MKDALTLRSLIIRQPGGERAMGFHVERFVYDIMQNAFPYARIVNKSTRIDGGAAIILIHRSTMVLLEVKVASVPTLLPPSLFIQVADSLRTLMETRTSEGPTSAVLVTNYRTSDDMNAKMREHAITPVTIDLDEQPGVIQDRLVTAVSALLGR